MMRSLEIRHSKFVMKIAGLRLIHKKIPMKQMNCLYIQAIILLEIVKPNVKNTMLVSIVDKMTLNSVTELQVQTQNVF